MQPNIQQKREIVMTLCDEYSRTMIFHAIHSRRIKACVILVISFGITALLVSFLFPMYRGLVYLSWLMILCNTFVPIAPHEPVILLYGKLYSPYLVAICAAMATSVIELANHRVLASILNLRKISGFREKQFYQRAEHYFSKLPFPSLLFACFAPVPFIPFRVLAVTTKYSFKKFALSVFLGRMSRFYLLALMGKALNMPAWGYITLFAITFSVVLMKKLAGRTKGGKKEKWAASDLAQERLTYLGDGTGG